MFPKRLTSFRFLVSFCVASCLFCGASAQTPPTNTLVFTPEDVHLKRKNLLNNSSFEWDDYESRGIRDGLAADWGLWGKGYGQYSDKSVPSLPNEATHATRAQRIELTAEGKEVLTFVQAVRGLKGGLPYSFSADVKIDDPAQVEVSLALQFYGAEKHLSTKHGDWFAPTKYTRVSVSGLSPDDADQVRTLVLLRPKKDNARGVLWVDAAQLEQSEKPTEYCSAYERGPVEFVSPPIDLTGAGDPYKFSWIACQPAPTHLKFQLRSANTQADLANARWLGPSNAEAYSTRIETGPNLIADPSVELDADGNGEPDCARTIGYGDNDRKFSVVEDAHDGQKALKVEIARYKDGDGRWHVATGAPLEKDTEYAFSVWHKENSPTTPIRLSVTLEDAAGQMHWGKGGGDTREACTSWRKDTLYFRTPKDMDIRRLWVQVSLVGIGWIVSDSYSVRRVVGAEEWPVNPAHKSAKWLQYKAVLSTENSYYTPTVYRVEFKCGPSVPDVRWFNILSEQGGHQKYSFNPGQTAVFAPEVIDFTGHRNIERVELVLKEPSGKEAFRSDLRFVGALSEEEACFVHRHTFPTNAPLGEWQAVVNVRGKSGATCSEMVVLKVRQPYKTPPQRMVVGALVDDYGFSKYKGERLQELIAKYRSCKELEIWKLAVAWKRLEPTPGQVNEEVIAGFRTFISAAHAAGAKAQITIQQQSFPDWANNGDWDNVNRYRYEQTKRLAQTWVRLASALKDCAGLESYLLINEENHVRDADAYLRAMSKLASAVRQADPNLQHRITIRPNTRDPYIRTRIATDGAHDYDYGSGGYPTSAAWYFKKYASPVSPTACLRMAYFHESPIAFGGPGGIGEVGFFNRVSRDAFGDEEKLAGFQRAMQVAYEMGMDEFMLWGGGFSFERLDVYFPRLIAFRNELLKKPRPTRFDVRVVLDTDDRLYVDKPPASSELDMTAQHFAAAIRFLDEKGFVWFFTRPDAMAIQDVQAQATVNLSELKDKSAEEQERFLAERLRGIKPSGSPLPWPDKAP